MNSPSPEIPKTDYEIYLDYNPPVEDVLRDPDGYRLLMLFPDNPELLSHGSLFDHQQWLYSDKDWLFYEDRSGELVRTPNTPVNQPGNWRMDSLEGELSRVTRLLDHRINVSQRRLMGMADRSIPDPEAYSREEDRLNDLVEKLRVLTRAREELLPHQSVLHPMIPSSDAEAVMGSIQKEIHDRCVSPRHPELTD